MDDDDQYESQRLRLIQTSHITFIQNRKVETYRQYLPHCMFSFFHCLQITRDHVTWEHKETIFTAPADWLEAEPVSARAEIGKWVGVAVRTWRLAAGCYMHASEVRAAVIICSHAKFTRITTERVGPCSNYSNLNPRSACIKTPNIVTEGLHGFSQTLQSNARKVPQSR
jgi:hypothetical protein